MNRKIKNTLGLVALLAFILIVGIAYIFVFQRGDIKKKEARLKELKSNDYNTLQLQKQLTDAKKRSAVLDSVLAARKFNIPQNISSIKFYNFVNDISRGFNSRTQINIEFVEQKPDKEFFYYQYKVSGGGLFSDVYKLIYAIEQSKELKKIKSVSLTNLVSADKDGVPSFLVNYNMTVDVYFATDSRFATSNLVENKIRGRTIYDVFYPLIRNEIPPNVDQLLDVQGAKLLALVPEGAFLSDSKGNTYLLWEGEQVYLGYLTKIDYENNKVSFIVNKGGIIERVDLSLEKDELKKKNK